MTKRASGAEDEEGGHERALHAVLELARAEGFLGRGPVAAHIDHARALLRSVPAEAQRFVDLGSGGGVPGLVLAVDRTELAGVLLDGSTRRGAFLTQAIDTLKLAERIEVWVERAEDVGRDSARRAQFDVVVSRSFGPPAVVAECAAPLLAVGGTLIVSDPPGTGSQAERWPSGGLAQFGLEVVKHDVGPPTHTALRQVAACSDRFPRRVGIPAKRPLF